MSIDKIIDIVTVLLIVAPVVVNLVKLLGAITHNKSIQTLADRAMIIVSSLDSVVIPNDDKKREAMNKLLSFAQETGVKLTAEQAEDYIEHSVQELRRLQDLTTSTAEVTDYEYTPQTK